MWRVASNLPFADGESLSPRGKNPSPEFVKRNVRGAVFSSTPYRVSETLCRASFRERNLSILLPRRLR